MLKTISYSIVFIPKRFDDIQEKKNIFLNKKDVFFNNLDNGLFLQYLIRDITKNNDIIVEEDKTIIDNNIKTYHTSNNLDIILCYPIKMIIQYTADEIKDCKAKEIKDIALNLIEKIKCNNGDNVISRLGLNQDYSIEYENVDAFEKLQKIILLKDESINRSVLSFAFNKDEKTILNMSIYNKIENRNKLFINTNLESKITNDNDIPNVINDKNNDDFIKSKIDSLVSLLKK